ncbi:MAG: class I SAM-dependent methyltransferase [Chloroflexota bacterium]
MEPLTIIALIVIVVISTIFLLYWLLITTEGVYLGRRVVIWLYDVYASRYDNIKKYEPGWESATLGRPLLRALLDIPAPLVLDVATGTGRLPLALFGQPAFNGYIIGLDYSRRMLTVAAEKLAPLGLRMNLIYQPAQKLPFADNTFDAVTCLEALEFMPDPDAVIAELVRVARPGALLLLTVRKGIEARLMPGKTMARDAFTEHLHNRFKLEELVLAVWQMDYDQVWALKPGEPTPAPEHALEAILQCPNCGRFELVRTVNADVSGLRCLECEAWIPIGADGVIDYADYAKT